MSVSTENFIKTVYKLQRDLERDPRTGYIAGELGISNAAATDMARKLARKNLIVYRKYKEISLTPDGEEMALVVLRKHRLWETFLHRTFNLSLHEIHREAEMLEHQTSDFMMEKLCDYLGNPGFDPHGDPIPSKDGKISDNDPGMRLSVTEPGKYYEITRLQGSDKEFYEFCISSGISVGTEFKLKKQYEKNEITEIYLNNIRLMLGKNITDKILIREIKKN